MLDFLKFTHLTFDCYGTLIDWETGILNALRPVFADHGVSVPEEEILQEYVRLEADLETGPFRPYREVLRGVVAGMGAAFGFIPSEADLEALPASVGTWPPFPDTIAALKQLSSRYRLVILSNVDNDLFEGTREQLEVEFSEVITAEQVGSYKPHPAHFHEAFGRLGVGPGKILHVAQSVYHDHVPARALGIRSVWVKRPSRLSAIGLAPHVEADLDLIVSDLRALSRLAGLGGVD